MLPSSTVENYLKAIYLGVGGLTPPHRLMPMGQLATALGVAPGTATTMVKTLAESGLVEYEPYTGVTLTSAGQKLAALVVRRHRVIEVFLVQVMGLRWDEVHDEAEQLEHVVSERLIDRMDEMLGRPEVDPHGDPIPDPEGVVKPQEAQNLLTCPLHVRVTVTRVLDQDKSFLRFIESHHLKPGESIEVEDRDAASDSVRVRGKDNSQITIGTRAASKLLVLAARAVVLVALCATTAFAQPPTAPLGSTRPWEILDNSFLVEEAFNQDANTFQNILGVVANGRDQWLTAFTQEWALFSHAHQFSYTLAFGNAAAGAAFGDAFVNYRLQVTDEGPGRPAFSPRISLILATGSAAKGLGGDAGWQVNLPFSKQAGDAYFHWNAGFTHFPSATVEGSAYNLVTPHVAASAIWRARPMFNFMLEGVVEWEASVENGVKNRAAAVTVSPGFRTGWNSGDAQTIVGLAVPIVRADGFTDAGIFAYFSYELPFTRQP